MPDAERALQDIREQCEFILTQNVGVEARAVCNCVLSIITAWSEPEGVNNA